MTQIFSIEIFKDGDKFRSRCITSFGSVEYTASEWAVAFRMASSFAFDHMDSLKQRSTIERAIYECRTSSVH